MSDQNQIDNRDTTESENPFYKLVTEECKSEVMAVTVMLRDAMENKDVEGVCKASETLARIKQNAIITAANTQAILMRATSATTGKLSAADMEKLSNHLAATGNDKSEKR